MGRERKPFTLERLQLAIHEGKQRNTNFRHLEIPQVAYDELRADVKERLWMDLPETATRELPVLLTGVRITVWRPENVNQTTADGGPAAG